MIQTGFEPSFECAVWSIVMLKIRPEIHPSDFSVELQAIVMSPELKQRELALSGFWLNKTLDGPLVGAAGELLAEVYFARLLNANKISSFIYTGDRPGHDFEIIHKGKTLRIDVKTKRRTFQPDHYFEMSVPAYLYDNPNYADPDYFLCVQVNCDPIDHLLLNAGWVIGSISKGNYHLRRKLVLEGTPVGGPRGIQGLMPTDVYNVLFSDLKPPLALI